MIISGIPRGDSITRCFGKPQHCDTNVLTEKQRNGTVVTNTYNDLNLLTNRAIQLASGVLDTTGETYEYDGASR
ncbi:MAG: hypothetical protein MUO31_06055, partial [Thermodesulfovibrionales bacterium]|nr:hypothetical protein [Thermodesulfovibrionales bacterium]